MKNTTEIVFVLDRSGSMCGLEDDTIGGFNSTVERQRLENGEAFVTTILFDDKIEYIHDRVSLDTLPPLTRKEYYVRGCTALLDAIGDAITHIKGVHRYIRKEDVPEKTIFVITTDGEENASSQYSLNKVKNLIKEQTEKGWEFIFLGANIDAIGTAAEMGIDKSRASCFKATPDGIECSYDAVATAISYARKNKSLDTGAWKRKLERKGK